ncbi:GNAT family N-acetyltransferase [Caloramator sp. CAR-1]|uniref:GNAT family N-acetyltransferase n=1 Tax=Caloramator sp. CAR-1 TaxID=3062777 RepID=UPI0026E205FC|nr:GNAT family N-acetyltransferase [Caloramator sp. CAR-1]MDO6354636.1 GNAT family N-acetyltransferase [Caloramator sp. CAR-1]
MIRKLFEIDRKIVEEYLKRNHIETTFLIGNIKYFGIENNKELRRCGDYYGYFEKSELKGILPFYNLGSCIPHYESEGAIPYFVELMKDREFKYLLGMRRVIEPLYKNLKDVKSIGNISDDAYYINKNLIEFQCKDIEIKNYYELDLDLAAEFLVEASQIGFGRDDASVEEAKKTLVQRPVEEDYLFAIKDGKMVATACIQATTDEISQIGGVYTTPKERGKGYCKAVVSELCRIIIERGKIPTLMVRKNNTSAVKAYEALGFEFYDDYMIIEL